MDAEALQKKIEELERLLRISDSFHKTAVKQRDTAWAQNRIDTAKINGLTKMLVVAQAELDHFQFYMSRDTRAQAAEAWPEKLKDVMKGLGIDG